MFQQKPLLLFLHGMGGSSDQWRQQMWYFVSCGYEVSFSFVTRSLTLKTVLIFKIVVLTQGKINFRNLAVDVMHQP